MRYVQRRSVTETVLTRRGASDSPEQQERVLLHGDESAGPERLRGRLAGRELDLPARAEAPRRQGEHDRLRVHIEDEQERLAEERLPVRCALADLATVEEDAERPRLSARPVPLRHPPPVRPEPPRVRQPAVACLPAQERRAPEDRMLAAELDQPPREREQVRVGGGPVEPRDLVVLAPRVVVAALGTAQLVAPEHHRDALGEEQRRE